MKTKTKAKKTSASQDIPLDVIPGKRTKRIHDADFKYSAVALADKVGAEAAAKELDLSRSLITTWQGKVKRGEPLLRMGAFSKRLPKDPADDELARVKAEIRRTIDERDSRLERAAIIVEAEGPQGSNIAKSIRAMKSKPIAP